MRPATSRKLLRATLALALLAGVALAAISGLYRYGLTLVPEMRPPSAAPAPPLVSAALSARFGGDAAGRLERMTPWSFVRLRFCRLGAAWMRPADGRETCLRQHSGIRLASALAREHVAAQEGISGFARDLGHAATTAWLTRRWDSDEALRALAASARWHQGWQGVEEAALGLFGKPAAALVASEAALLAATLPDEENHSPAADPWCDPEAALEARNRVLSAMVENGALASTEGAVTARSPLSIRDHRCLP